MQETEEKFYMYVDGVRIEMTPEEIVNFKREHEEIERLNFPIEKQNRIKQLKTNCSNYIYSKYPIYKQLNIANGITQGREDMQHFIYLAKNKCDNLEKQLEQTTTIEQLNSVNINFGEKNNEQ